MTELQRRVAAIVSSILEIPVESVKPETTTDDVESWDSVRHMHVVLALEQEFGVSFDDDQVVVMLSIGEIARVLQSLGPAR